LARRGAHGPAAQPTGSARTAWPKGPSGRPTETVGPVRPKSARCRSSHRAQAATWAWAGKAARCARAPGPNQAQFVAGRISSVHFHQTADRSFRWNKKHQPNPNPKPRSSLLRFLCVTAARVAPWRPRRARRVAAAGQGVLAGAAGVLLFPFLNTTRMATGHHRQER
jgi:hypothetical protein